MNVFISWSGKTSGELAKILRDWLPSVIQAVKPYFSTDDIEKGTRGNTMLAKELEEAGIGILCLTRENLEAPWIMFEAGSLSKSLDTSRVCPILFGDLSTTDLKGPLVQFQAAKFNKDDMYKVIAVINTHLGEIALDSKILESVFEKWWPELDQKVKEILSSTSSETNENIRSERELLEEILTLARQIHTLGTFTYSAPPLGAFTITKDMVSMAKSLIPIMKEDTLHDHIRKLYGVSEDLAMMVIENAKIERVCEMILSRDESEEIKSEVKKLRKTGQTK